MTAGQKTAFTSTAPKKKKKKKEEKKKEKSVLPNPSQQRYFKTPVG